MDAIIIGSGAAGLACAVALAQAGKKVVVLEQHYVPGGWCHTFQLNGYRFSPGVHYIGKLQPGGRLRRIYEGLGVSEDVEFCELNPEGFDHVLAGGQRFDIPKGKEAFAAKLKQRFPSEASGIDGYLNAVEKLADELDREGQGILGLLRSPTLLRWGLFSAQTMIRHFVSDPFLQAILAAQCGDHGLPPSMAPAPVQAAVMAHYFHGGYYPRGGGFAIPRAFVRALKRAGGELRLKAAVEKILIENGRAVGVRLAGGEEVRAKAVISNADPEMTFRRLVGEDGLPASLKRRLARTKYSVSALSLFLAVDCDLRAAGMDSGNYWYYETHDVDGIYKKGMRPMDPQINEVPPGMFLTCTTLKDPSKFHRGKHTLEAFTFCVDQDFRSWWNAPHGQRPADYEQRKEALTQAMLQGVYKIMPAIEGKVVFRELGTPLTNLHYIAAAQGSLYGTEKTLSQVGPFGYPIRTAIDGLWMCGASTTGHGVVGATSSGLNAAAAILDCRPEDLLTQKGPALRIYPSEHPESWPADVQRSMPVRA